MTVKKKKKVIEHCDITAAHQDEQSESCPTRGLKKKKDMETSA